MRYWVYGRNKDSGHEADPMLIETDSEEDARMQAAEAGMEVDEVERGRRRLKPSANSPITRLGTRWGLYFIAALSVLPAPFAVAGFIKGRDSLHWPTTDAVVTHSSVIRGRKFSYRAQVRYRYRVEGRDYTGSQIGASP